jgi:hypothetical protein
VRVLLSLALATEQILSPFSRWMRRTPWVARPDARTCLVWMRATLPLAVMIERRSSVTLKTGTAGPIFGEILRMICPLLPCAASVGAYFSPFSVVLIARCESLT